MEDNKEKTLFFISDITGTITGYEKTIDENGNPLDAAALNEKIIKRRTCLEKIAWLIKQYQEINNCSKVLFSFASENDVEEINKRLTELEPFFEKYGIEIGCSLCCCNGSRGFVTSSKNGSIFKKDDTFTCKIDMITKLLEIVNSEDSVIYADDCKINRQIIEYILSKRKIICSHVLGTDYVECGEVKKGLKGLCISFERLCKEEEKRKKNKR